MSGFCVNFAAKELEVGKTNMSDFRAHRWRAIWTHKGVEGESVNCYPEVKSVVYELTCYVFNQQYCLCLVGIAEAPRKMMAKQVAAFDLIEKMKDLFPAYNLPDCYVPDGALVNPFLFSLLENKCEQKNYGPPEFQLKVSVNFKGKKEFTSICFVEDDVFIGKRITCLHNSRSKGSAVRILNPFFFFSGKSFDIFYAKRFAVKKAYETLVGFKYPNDKIIRGDQCFKDQDDNYHSIESAVSHVYVCYEKVSLTVMSLISNRISFGLVN